MWFLNKQPKSSANTSSPWIKLPQSSKPRPCLAPSKSQKGRTEPSSGGTAEQRAEGGREGESGEGESSWRPCTQTHTLRTTVPLQSSSSATPNPHSPSLPSSFVMPSLSSSDIFYGLFLAYRSVSLIYTSNRNKLITLLFFSAVFYFLGKLIHLHQPPSLFFFSKCISYHGLLSSRCTLEWFCHIPKTTLLGFWLELYYNYKLIWSELTLYNIQFSHPRA